MKRITNRIAIALMFCMLMSVAAFAKIKSQTIAFGQDFTIGNTLVKRGTYRVSFDDVTNELTIADKKTKAVVAKVTARAESRTENSLGNDIKLVKNGDTQIFNSIAFHGDNRIISVNATAATDSTTSVVN